MKNIMIFLVIGTACFILGHFLGYTHGEKDGYENAETVFSEKLRVGHDLINKNMFELGVICGAKAITTYYITNGSFPNSIFVLNYAWIYSTNTYETN